MALQEKYKELIDAATAASVSDLNVREQDGVLYIDGATNGTVKQQLWDTYERLDPNYASGDLVMNISSVAGVPEGAKLKVTTNSSNLNIRKGPSTNDDIVGKAARHEIVTLVGKENDQWWMIKTDAGEQGYSFTQYLTPVG
ncbi:SH3 domain-containing protein [Pedobacter gandavensis]|uniref:SH3 domain-containing protein n=1 Tax=Pedobacter gandavensis TaxID=2679963 RepID=A0ABR6F2I6_9SPHI|nr:SH3 domain-containing protein [Pedobacter gandavensis]MBB2151744.1 SH3 domain-containing protein [Pedobacter gandavensis]